MATIRMYDPIQPHLLLIAVLFTLSSSRRELFDLTSRVEANIGFFRNSLTKGHQDYHRKFGYNSGRANKIKGKANRRSTMYRRII